MKEQTSRLENVFFSVKTNTSMCVYLCTRLNFICLKNEKHFFSNVKCEMLFVGCVCCYYIVLKVKIDLQILAKVEMFFHFRWKALKHHNKESQKCSSSFVLLFIMFSVDCRYNFQDFRLKFLLFILSVETETQNYLAHNNRHLCKQSYNISRRTIFTSK